MWKWIGGFVIALVALAVTQGPKLLLNFPELIGVLSQIREPIGAYRVGLLPGRRVRPSLVVVFSSLIVARPPAIPRDTSPSHVTFRVRATRVPSTPS